MTKIAGKTEWVETENGIRRLVVEGAPIPPGLGLEDSMSEEVEARTLSRPVVDEEAAKSHYERTGAKAPEPNAGISTENVEKAQQGSRSRARSSKPSGGSES